jgi:hypothetical protein
MADSDIAMFDAKGRATSFQHARWRAKGGLQPLQTDAVLAEQGRATDYYRRAWRTAFPTRRALPMEPIATRAGKFTQAMLDVWL